MGVYKIQNKINGRCYIGITNDWERRLKQHLEELKYNYHSCEELQDDYNKYGLSAFTFDMICNCEEEDLPFMEVYYIKRYDAYTNGYNRSQGGEYGKLTLKKDEVKNVIEGKIPYELPSKHSIIRGKEVYCPTNGKLYKSARAASEELGIPYSTVISCCNGELSSGNGHFHKRLGLELWYLSRLEH